MKCIDYFPSSQELFDLKQNFIFNILFYCSCEREINGKQIVNIDDIPKDIKHLVILSNCIASYLNFGSISQRFESIYCLCRHQPTPNFVQDFSRFQSVKRINIFMMNRCYVFPERIEELEIHCFGVSFKKNSSKYYKLKRITLVNCSNNTYTFRLPSQLDYLCLEGKKFTITDIEKTDIKELRFLKEVHQQRNHQWIYNGIEGLVNGNNFQIGDNN